MRLLIILNLAWAMVVSAVVLVAVTGSWWVLAGAFGAELAAVALVMTVVRQYLRGGRAAKTPQSVARARRPAPVSASRRPAAPISPARA